MKLPNAHKAIVHSDTILKSLLNPNHPAGGPKSDFFLGHGYSVSDWEALRDALIRHAVENQVANSELKPRGMVYVIEGPMPTPAGRTPSIRSVWIVNPDETTPPFVTAYPLES